jgi:hypothetical protein
VNGNDKVIEKVAIPCHKYRNYPILNYFHFLRITPIKCVFDRIRTAILWLVKKCRDIASTIQYRCNQMFALGVNGLLPDEFLNGFWLEWRQLLGENGLRISPVTIKFAFLSICSGFIILPVLPIGILMSVVSTN